MIVEKNRICVLLDEIERLKSELNKTYGYVIELVSELEDKLKQIIQEDKQLLLINEKNAKIAGEERLKNTLKMERAAVHELSQPLTVLIGRCELLDALVNKHPEIAKHVNSILSCAKRISEIVRKIQGINKQMMEQCAGTSAITDIEQSSDSRPPESP